jgi:hypothetical protein
MIFRCMHSASVCWFLFFCALNSIQTTKKKKYEQKIRRRHRDGDKNQSFFVDIFLYSELNERRQKLTIAFK